MPDIITGGNGTDGKVSVRGKDGQPLVELLGRDNECVIDAGQGGNRPARLTMYNGQGQQTVNLSTADATLRLGGSPTNGTVSVLGKDGKPLVELLGRDNECVIGAGQGGNRPARLTMYNGQGQQTVNLSTADATLRLGGSPTNGTVSVLGKDGKPLVELLGRDNECVIGAGQGENRPARLTMYNGQGQQTVNLSTADATLRLGGGPTNGTVSVLGKDGKPLVELLGRDNECVIGLGQANRPGRISMYSGNQQEALRLDGASGDIVLMNADCADSTMLSR